MKAKTTIEKLCRKCPAQFTTYMKYVTALAFEEAADFSFLKSLILEAADDANLNIFDNIYDWSLILTQMPPGKKSVSFTLQKHEVPIGDRLHTLQ